MASNMNGPYLESVDVRHLYYFAVVAEECSFRRASERLFMAQPPLSRQVKQLEERLGVALFLRHSKGLTLTEAGANVLGIIQPLLEMQKATFAKLQKEIRPQGKTLRIGFTTAFEQGIFAKLEAKLCKQYGSRLLIHRTNSPKLAIDIRKGRLDAAFVALPLEFSGVLVREIPYAEPLVAALPAHWPKTAEADSNKPLLLNSMNGKQLFWFKRERNPAFFDLTKGWFAHTGFMPHCVEEPVEHDVLLARIASGEGMGLFACSFTSIMREGVLFFPLAKKHALSLQLGILTLPQNSKMSEELSAAFMASHKPD